MTQWGDVPGLTYFREVVDSKTESEVYSFLGEQKWSPGPSGPDGRRVQQYGYSYDYMTKTIKPAPPVPTELATLIAGLQEKKVLNDKVNQIIVNEYTPGQGITPHTDNKKWFGEQIASLTLNSGCNMTMKRGSIIRTIYLEPRSLLLLAGKSRWEYTHSIAPTKSDRIKNPDGTSQTLKRGTRVSITFRQVTNTK